MIKRLLIALFTTGSLFSYLYALELMDEEFLIHYGNPQAPLKVIEYFSFACPHCPKVFQDFAKIKEEFIDKGLIYFTFQAVPKDLTTMRALHCLSLLNSKEKQIFLEGLFAYLSDNEDPPDRIYQVMQEFLSCFNKQAVAISDLNDLKKLSLMQKSFDFVAQKDQVQALPTVEMNGFLFAKEVPSYAFFVEAVKAGLGEKK